MAGMNSRFWKEFIIAMPKVELHLHLEGAFTFPTLLTLIRKYGDEPSIQTVDDIQRRFLYKDFAGFIDCWIWKNKYFRRGEDFELSAYQTLLNLHAQNVLEVEAFFSPWDFAGNGIDMEEITESVLTGCERATRECGIHWRLIADVNREHGPEAGMARVDQICRYQPRGVVGIGLGGREDRYPAGLYEEVYAEAGRRGLYLTAHAGEAAGPESVWSALSRLGVHRIGHGVRAQEDPRLIQALCDRQLPLEMCPTSNVRTGVVSTLREHPLRQYLESGLKVTLNTDDPTMFGCTLTGEYLALLDQPDWDIDKIRMLSLNGVDALFLDTEKKQILRRKFETEWERAYAASG